MLSENVAPSYHINKDRKCQEIVKTCKSIQKDEK